MNAVQRKSWEITAQIVRMGVAARHIAFCMDGNRRFAKKLGMKSQAGHYAGLEAMMKILAYCQLIGIRTVTVYAFSIENFHRSDEETSNLLGLMRTQFFDQLRARATAYDIELGQKMVWRIRFPGNRAMMPKDLAQRMDEIEAETAKSAGMTVNICCPYTTRDDIAHAIGTSTVEPSRSVAASRYLANSEPLDIFIRTSGETRFSDFMCWEIESNCQVEFVSKLWPEFTPFDLFRILVRWSFNRRYKVESLDAMPPAPPFISVSKREIAS